MRTILRWWRSRRAPAAPAPEYAPIDTAAHAEWRKAQAAATELLASLLAERATRPSSPAARWYSLAARHAQLADECSTESIRDMWTEVAKRDEQIADAYADGDEYRALHLIDEERQRGRE